MRITSSVQTRKRHKKILKLAKGFTGARRNRHRCAKEAVEKALEHRTIDRKINRRNVKRLWIKRISNILSNNGYSYSRSIGSIKSYGLNSCSAAYLAARCPQILISIVSNSNEKK